ncbi:(2Fe-2S)-binding protein [Candidatus Poriferisodalis sp.]|uniref:(2Fe-2S)-binding protein n=1 Tax=Candidatus Poriferisodalis sp. TaxID=3101277 RepID=UPI003B01367D
MGHQEFVCHLGTWADAASGVVSSMIVCQCLATNEAAIREIHALGGTTVSDVYQHCGAGSDCAGCVATIQAVLDQCALATLEDEHPRARVRV